MDQDRYVIDITVTKYPAQGRKKEVPEAITLLTSTVEDTDLGAAKDRAKKVVWTA